MRIEPSDVGWVVHYEPNEIQLARGPWPHSGLLGFINRRGTISVSYPAIAGLPRDWGARARDKLEDVRAELWESGALRNPREEARARAESRTGDFIVRLSDGRERRFHSFRTDQPYLGGRARGRGHLIGRTPSSTWVAFPMPRSFAVLRRRFTCSPKSFQPALASALWSSEGMLTSRSTPGRKPPLECPLTSGARTISNKKP